MSEKELAVIVIPVHNRKAHTLHCLGELKWCMGLPGWKIVVVDDGSVDGTAEEIARSFPAVNLVFGNGSLYWTGGILAGMRRGIELGATAFVWLNDDTETSEISLRRLVSRVTANMNEMVGASPWVDKTPMAFSSLRGKGVVANPGERLRVDVLAGFLVAFSIEVVRKIGLPDADGYPHYAGDSEYTRRAQNNGIELWLDGDAVVNLRGFKPYPTVAEYFWGPETLDLTARFKRTFFERGSKFRLSTQKKLDQLYRGKVLGMVAFLVRLGLWAGQIGIANRGRSDR
jgi:GT2 family glycosyltransferase